MAKPRRINDKHLAYVVIGFQALIALVVPLLVWWFASASLVKAALFGGWIAVLANGYFAIQAFRYSGARASSAMLKAFYRGEAGKFIIVAVLFVAAFRVLGTDKQQALVLVAAFIGVQSVTWFAPLLLKRRGF